MEWEMSFHILYTMVETKAKQALSDSRGEEIRPGHPICPTLVIKTQESASGV